MSLVARWSSIRSCLFLGRTCGRDFRVHMFVEWLCCLDTRAMSAGTGMSVHVGV